ncbi:hypothetical protein DM02DRAFT_416183 [Periconia macrospinosa]|uniref:Uncharacterized protein n=1 Tax=Periconia macrospinosa TaxID=97972 RepID=A0A2V1CY63_9PLEO|nr:hypothetical protein DM02DRAFT_416183 [Periconia macrospinosa]
MTALPVFERVDGVQVEHGNASTDRTWDCPIFNRAVTDSITYRIRSKSVRRETTDHFSPSRTTAVQPLGQGKRKILRFDEKVEQFRATDVEGAERDWSARTDDDSSDEGLLMKFPLKERACLHKNTENNSCTNSKMIKELPPTTLKSRSPSPQETLSWPYPPTDSLVDEEDATKLELSKCTKAFDDLLTIRDGRAAKNKEKKPPETSEDISIPSEDAQGDIISVEPVNELTRVLQKGKDIAQAICKYRWLRLLEYALTQCQSIPLALLGARTRTPSPREREDMSHVAGDEDLLN